MRKWFLKFLVIWKYLKLYHWLVIPWYITNNLWQICVVKILQLQGLQSTVWQLLTQVRTSFKVQGLTTTQTSILHILLTWHSGRNMDVFICGEFKTPGKILDSGKQALRFPCLSLSSTLPIKWWLGGGGEFLVDNNSLLNPQSHPVHPLTYSQPTQPGKYISTNFLV